MSIDSFWRSSFEALCYLGNPSVSASSIGLARTKCWLCAICVQDAVGSGLVTLPVACISDLAVIRPAVNLAVLEDAGGERFG